MEAGPESATLELVRVGKRWRIHLPDYASP